MSDAIVIREGVRVPAGAVTVRAVRASGPGGQNVNKVATKVSLHVDLDAIEGLTDEARGRLRDLARHRLDAEGRLVISSQLTRNQARNLDDSRAKVRDLVAAALVRPRRRKPSRPSAAAQERRLTDKKERASVKRLRSRLED